MSYDPTNPVHGQAQIPGLGGDGYGNVTGSAASGRASVGRAGIPRPAVDQSYNSGYGYGAEPGGGYGYGADSGGYAYGAEPAGRASVPGQGSGRASVPAWGAARVPDYGGEADSYSGGGGGGMPPNGGDRGYAQDPGDSPRRHGGKGKWRHRRNLIVASIVALVLMLGGAGLIAGTYYFDTVEVPENISLKQSTTIFYADGKEPMAKIGAENRSLVTIDKVPKHVQFAVVAAEDNTFYTNNGVDYKGIVRALWNNSTGGQKQGASTITQQYAKNILQRKDVSYGKKLREAVLAMKLSKQYDKDKIMEMYLNTVFFGRQSYGIQAASKAYFNKDVNDLTVAEGMVLAAVIKQPTSTDGKGGSPYDPSTHAEDATNRFNYVKNNMVKLKFISPTDAESLKLPTAAPINSSANSEARGQFGLDTPTGLVVHHVMDELSRLKAPDGTDRFPDLRNSGLKIITTIDKKMQDAAVAAADPGSQAFKAIGFKDQDKLQAALVSVETGTGRVKAYYGGPNGSGTDYAGVYQDPVLSDGKWSSGGAHPPGSTMKVYTMATALMNDYSVNSVWDGAKTDFSKETGRKAPINAGNPSCGSSCTLAESATLSLNSPFYAVAAKLGPEKVVQTAKAAGIRYMWSNDGTQYDLNKLTDKTSITSHFSAEVGFGQFPITPLEHANGIATIANRGAAATEHFVEKVLDRSGNTVYAGPVGAKPVAGLTQAMTDAMNPALQEVVKHYNVNLDQRDSAGKSGTWQWGKNPSENAHAWFVGYTASDSSKNIRGLATAVWLGSKAEEEPLKFKNGTGIIGGYGSGPIWKNFMNAALKGTKAVKFPDFKDVGSNEQGNGTPKGVPSDPSSMFPDPNNQNPGWPGNNGGWPGGNNGGNNGQDPGGNNGGNNGGNPGNTPANPGGNPTTPPGNNVQPSGTPFGGH